jgi:multicomponent K+:H+ antiporter subunit D
VVLVVGFFTLLGLARAGASCSGISARRRAGQPRSGSSVKLLSAVWAFMALTLAMAVLAPP